MDLIFIKGNEPIAIRIINKKIYFSKIQGQWVKYTGVEGLKFSIAGILRQFPDLKDKSPIEIRKIGVQRFLKHIDSLPDDKSVAKYLQNDLMGYGYSLKYTIRKGFRPKVARNDSNQ